MAGGLHHLATLSAKITQRSPNTITLLCDKHNIMLIFPSPRNGLLRPASHQSYGAHFRPQAVNKMFDVMRQRRAALHCDISVELGRLGDAQQFDAGIAAMGDGELIDHRDPEPGLDQRADLESKTRPDR